MSSEQDKKALRARFEKQLRHLVGRDEELRRKQEAKARQRQQGGGRRGQQLWSEDDEAEAFAKMPRRAAAPARAEPVEVPADLPRATVTAVYQARVDLDGVPARIAPRLLLDPHFRLVVGDEVAFVATEGPPRVVAVMPRRTWLGRPDPGNPHRELVLVANVDVAVIVAAVADPPLRPGLIDRYLLALARGGVEPAVCANKVDLLPGGADDPWLAATLAPYEELSIPVWRCSASTGAGIGDLRAQLAGATGVFVGHSGVGKSSLLNAIDPDGDRSVAAVARAGKGRHTTTGASLRRLGDGTRVIDTPGVRAFGLDHLPQAQLRAGFPEFAAFAGACRFADCTHAHEPDCAVLAAVAAGRLSAARHASYLRILASADE